jgi:acryloyl-coenzyme A reductase
LQVGESTLITGAGGGLGLHAVQLARQTGAFVIAQTTSPDKVELVRSMGAHEVVLHARGEDFSSQVKKLTDGKGVDVLIDNVGTPLFDAMRKSLAQSGRWIMIGQLTGEFVPFNPAQLFLKNQSMYSVMSTSRHQLEDVLTLMKRGQIKPVITASFPLEEAAKAHELVETGKAVGRIVMRPNG